MKFKAHSTLIFSLSGFVSSLFLLLIFTVEPGDKMPASHTLLCLGDSYTIGESVSPAENFPNQLVTSLKKSGVTFDAPEIVAKTGWTTDELQSAIDAHQFKPSYDFVTLLIGVNNQYRGRQVAEYEPQFDSLLREAIRFAGNRADHVMVLSIPDWGATPFAEGRDRGEIAKEIDQYNEANRRITLKYAVQYIDITPGTREAVSDQSLIANDGLHPSAKEYGIWVKELNSAVLAQLK